MGIKMHHQVVFVYLSFPDLNNLTITQLDKHSYVTYTVWSGLFKPKALCLGLGLSVEVTTSKML